MSATVAAALKKIAVYIVTNKKTLKIVGGIVLGIVIIIIMPIAAVTSFFNGSIEIDTDRLQELVIENLSAEEKERLQYLEKTMKEIESAMTAAGYAGKIKEAQVLYTLALSGKTHEANFITKLVHCFSVNQTDEQFIASVNSTFGLNLNVSDFKKAMTGIRAVYINTAQYTDPTRKNNLDLVQWAIEAEEAGWGYIYGTYGTVLSEAQLDSKVSQYPDEVGQYEEFIRQNWLGSRTTDCIGLIKGYGWFKADTQELVYASNEMPDISADTMYENAAEKGTIDTIPEIPGLAVWHEGHIGVYIGGDKVVQAANTTAGVTLTDLGDTAWTHWLKVPYISYMDTKAE